MSNWRWRVVLLACAALAGCSSSAHAPLWPGAKYTEGDRRHAMLRAIDYIRRSSLNKDNFAAYSSDYLYCFDSIANTARDLELRATAARFGRDTAHRWAVANSSVPATANSDEIADLIFGWLAAADLGEDDRRIKPRLARAAARFTAMDYLLFDPAKEAPPADVPARCKYDSAWNPRGATVCRKCGRPLHMRSKYDVWLDALITSYTGERYGVPLGGSYGDVLRWMPSMRPYLDSNQTTYEVFIDTVYSLTHVVYTLNDYGRYLLPRSLLPQEYAYLRRNLPAAMALHDPETMGEFLDTLKSFGLNAADQPVRTGMAYLLDTQRSDGTWSAPGQKDPYTLYHSAWTGIDGLKDCNWHGQGLSFPQLRPLLERMR